ncbi:MAG: hypothetical protein D4R88_06555 [Methanosarcinales archaeon]|nr:MAG: hypothetical protein D4R88_06555 [Methanosarcinales archaeon]
MLDIIWNIPTVIDVISKIRNYFDWGLTKVKKRRNSQLHEFDFLRDEETARLWKGLLGKDFYLSKDLWRFEEVSEMPMIRPTDVICVSNAVLSRWVPLLPGQVFSTALRTVDEKRQALSSYIGEGGEVEAQMFFEAEAKIKSGVASFRVLPRRGHYLLCCSSTLTFTGVPVLVERELFEKKLQDALYAGHAATASLEGLLVEIPGEWNSELRSFVPLKLLKQYTLPRYALQVRKIREITDAPQTIAAAWTGFAEEEPVGYGETFKSCEFVVNDGDDAVAEASKKVVRMLTS